MYASHNLRFFYRIVFSSLLGAVVGTDGGTPAEMSLVPASLPVTAPAPALLPLIAGASSDLQRNRYPFSCNFTVTLGAGTTTGSTRIFSASSITAICAGRASAELISELVVTISPLWDAKLLAASGGFAQVNGALAIRQEGSSVPDTLAKTLSLPLSRAITAGMISQAPLLLEIPPGIHRNVLIAPIIGKPPSLVYSFNHVGATAVNITLQGFLSLEGMGQVDF